MPRILVVDDDEILLRMVARQLKKRHHELLLAESGKRAIEILSSEDVDLILLDQMMPIMDGLTTFRKIREKYSPYPPTIMFTAHGSMRLVIAFLKAGGNDFVLKPVDFDVLEVKISRAIRNEKFRRESEIKAKQELELKTLRLIAGTVAHEVNNALSVLSASLSCMKQVKENIPYFEKMRIGVERIKVFVVNLNKATNLETRDYVDGDKILNITGNVNKG